VLEICFSASGIGITCSAFGFANVAALTTVVLSVCYYYLAMHTGRIKLARSRTPPTRFAGRSLVCECTLVVLCLTYVPQ